MLLSRSAPHSAVSTEVVVLDDASRLHDHVPLWEDLARNALEPNVFYEPWMLLPAVRAFGAGEELSFALVLERDGEDPATRLIGFFPLHRRRHYRRLPVPMLGLWRHRHCFLCTPLVRASHASECLAAFLGWLEREASAPMIEWSWIAADGPFHLALARALAEAGRPVFEAERHTRGLLRRRESAGAYLAEALSKQSRKELRRQERRLAELAELRYEACDSAAAAPRWIEQFVSLEASGWKGERGSALGSSTPALDFFCSAAGEGSRRGRLEMLGLFLSGRPIALKCNFLAREGAFAFKIAYDEAFRRYSPGMLLELENIRRFHAQGGNGANAAEWMDSCADPGHFMVNRLWLDRRSMVTSITATGRVPGDLMVSALPLVRWLYRQAKSSE